MNGTHRVHEAQMIPEDYREQLRTEGFCVVPGVLSKDELARVQAALDRGAEQVLAGGPQVHGQRIDPNDANIRVYNLPALDPVFIELLRHPKALEFAAEVVGPDFIVSSFSANIALPGSRSMRLHSDQALAVPPPWHEPWAVNVIWCLNDIHEANGATRYLPGSHRCQRFEDLQPEPMAKTRAFAAPAGSFVVMEGRLWHTSGANVTRDERRALMFAYYVADFLRPQVNAEAALPEAVKAAMDPETRKLFGLGAEGNIRIGSRLTKLESAAS
jgi:hypothetical protein